MCGAHALDLVVIHALYLFGIFCREIDFFAGGGAVAWLEDGLPVSEAVAWLEDGLPVSEAVA